MTTEEKVEYWLDIASYDLGTAESMLRSGRYLYVAFMCQQSIEKSLKAYHIKKHGKEAPPSHNLSYLANLISLEMDEPSFSFLDRLTAFYIQARYPAYKEKLSEAVDEAEARDFLRQTKEVFEWLQSQVR